MHDLQTLLPLQELSLFHPTLLHVDEPPKPHTTSQTQCEQEVERTAVVPRIIDNRTAHQRADERTRLAHNAKQRKEQELLTPRRHLTDHRLAVAVPRTHKQAVESLIHPDLPALVEAEVLAPDADHAPAIEEHDTHCDDHEHGLGGQAVVLLYAPEGADTDGLSGDAHDKQVCELQTVVCDDFVLKCADDCDGCI